MPDIEIVIKMSEEEYNKIKENDMGFYNGRFFQMVRNGTVLPKGHGRLKDVDALDVTTIETDDYDGNEVLDVVLKEDIDEAPTIVAADNNLREDLKKARNKE